MTNMYAGFFGDFADFASANSRTIFGFGLIQIILAISSVQNPILKKNNKSKAQSSEKVKGILDLWQILNDTWLVLPIF